MKKSKQLENVTKILNYAVQNQLSTRKASEKLGFSKRYYKDAISELRKMQNGDTHIESLIEKFGELYPTFDSDSASISDNTIRDDSGNIIQYKIQHKDRAIAITLDQMTTLFRLYPKKGANLSLSDIGKEFPNWTEKDLKRILWKFGITKNSLPVPPHIYENSSDEEIARFIRDNKLRNIELGLKNLELNKESHTEYSNLQELATANIIRDKYIEALNDLSLKSFPNAQPTNKYGKKLVIYLSDRHVGAKTHNSIFGNEYNKEVYLQRMQYLFDKVCTLHKNMQFDEVLVIDMGDGLDGWNAKTVRGGHRLDQELDNREQFLTFVESTINFITSLRDNKIPARYIAVGEDNHSGDFGWISNKTIQKILPDSIVFDRFIDHIQVYDTVFVLNHGKDMQYKRTGFPLNPDSSTYKYINEYLQHNDISHKQKVRFVKGDGHQTATHYYRNLCYRATSSMYGASKYIHHNFGKSYAATDFDVIFSNNDCLEGRIDYETLD